MPQIKIHPLKRLPEHTLSKQEFQNWQNKLEIWLGEGNNMAHFMTEGRYNTWLSQKANPKRLLVLDQNDPDRPEENVRNRQDLLDELLAKRRRQLKTFLG